MNVLGCDTVSPLTGTQVLDLSYMYASRAPSCRRHLLYALRGFELLVRVVIEQDSFHDLMVQTGLGGWTRYYVVMSLCSTSFCAGRFDDT